MAKKELIIATVLTLVIAFMDISGLPFALFCNIKVLDITPFYWALMLNFVLIALIAFFVLKNFCPNLKLGFTKTNLLRGLKNYAPVGVLVGIIGGIAFYFGLHFDYKPTLLKVLVEGIIYYIGVAIIEELYVRALLLNIIEEICAKRAHKTTIAIVCSSFIFGLGHIFGTLGQPALVIVTKVIWTGAMGLYFGAIYKKTNNLWLPIILHFVINVCALPYCFTTQATYPTVSLYIILPAYILLGMYSFWLIKKQ